MDYEIVVRICDNAQDFKKAGSGCLVAFPARHHSQCRGRPQGGILP